MHILLGIALIIIPLFILKGRSPFQKVLGWITAGLSWLLIFPSGILYLWFYPATKTLIQAGSYPWLHSVLMETKEHWGLFLPIIATVAAGLTQREDKSAKRWWTLLIVIALLIGIIGRVIKVGARL